MEFNEKLHAISRYVGKNLRKYYPITRPLFSVVLEIEILQKPNDVHIISC